jgi:hypothetical protein
MDGPRAEPAQSVTLARAVYGQVLALSEVAALSIDHELGSAQILFGLLGTMFVFWLAHVYSTVVSARVTSGPVPPWSELRAAVRLEWPLFEAAAPAAFALLLGVLGVYGTRTAVGVAIGLGIANLFLWGAAMGRRSGWGATLVAGALSAALGVAVVLLKVLVA